MAETKIAIIGAGSVGASLAFSLTIKNVGSEIILVDVDKQKQEGEVMDLQQGLFFVETSHVNNGDFKDAAASDVIVITAGAAQKPGETRLDLVKKNTKILESIFKAMGTINPDAIIIMVANPVDILTYIAQKISGLPRNQVFGSGTTLDTSRLRYYLGQYFGVNPKSVHAYVIGEHGDSEFAAYNTANIAGVPLKEFPKYKKEQMDSIFKKTKKAAYEVIKRKGATYYAIALSVTEILEAIIYDQNRVLPVSVRLNSFYHNTYDAPQICLGVPAVIGRNGIQKIIDLKLNKSETNQFKDSAKTLKKVLSSVGY